MPGVQNITVTKAEAGQKLLQFLQRRVGRDVPKSAVMKWIRKGEVRVDKGRKKPFDRVREGQTVRIPPHHVAESESREPVRTLSIVHEDERIVVLHKPAGLAVHGGDGIEDSVAGRLRAMYADAPFMPGLAHRLDRDTTGLLVAGKSYESLRRLNDAFANGEVGKLYLARVAGRWPHDGTVRVEDRMEKRGKPGSERVRTGEGKAAAADVTLLKADERSSLLAVRLLTGRTHQIRVQLASRGHAVLGDGKYGDCAKGALQLHCFGLKLPDGEGGELTIQAAPDWEGGDAVGAAEMEAARELLRHLPRDAGKGIVM
ncbi:RluA family pseudouridine synthase [Salidesulfovibrio brasiliensis]|uniref:RluA family pseudouridine synthase n=1 Tax=Salidesulfovibrio brasiliensis TaxID=221711 RepID=UPI0006D2BE71|nr:RluA family pseudouridine synthase [Salidesulfovibrio brasiliensis]